MSVTCAHVCVWLLGVNVDGLPVTSAQLGQRVTYALGAALSRASQSACRSLT